MSFSTIPSYSYLIAEQGRYGSFKVDWTMYKKVSTYVHNSHWITQLFDFAKYILVAYTVTAKYSKKPPENSKFGLVFKK